MSSFVSNVVDASGDPLSCDYVGFHYDTGNTSDVHTTENQQVSYDSEDADWDSTGVVFAEGDVILHHLYTDDACCVVRIVSDGSDSYTQPMQLLGCQAPSATLYVEDGTVDNTVNASQVSSDEYQWEYEGTTHYHKAEWYGKTLCDSVGIDTVEYDWGDGWVSDSSGVFDAIGDYTIGLRVTNNCGLSTEVSKDIRIRYNAPEIVLSWEPSTPVMGDEVTVTVTITDVDEQAISGAHTIDGVDSGDSVVTFEYTYTLTEDKSYPLESRVVWNDGFEDQEVVVTGEIVLENQAPTIDMISTVGGDNDNEWLLRSNAIDPEDSLDRVEVKVYVDSNRIFSDIGEASWVLVKSYSVELDALVKFNTSGQYKITMQAVDSAGLRSEIDEIVVVITCPEGNTIAVPTETGSGKVVYVNTGSLVSGDIEIMRVNGSVDIVDAYGMIEPMDVNGDVEPMDVNGN